MKLPNTPITHSLLPAATPMDPHEATSSFRRRAWTHFQRNLDPLGTPKPLGGHVPKPL
jgi:hypothetical protein